MEEAPGAVRAGNVRRSKDYTGSADLPERHAGGRNDLAGSQGGRRGGALWFAPNVTKTHFFDTIIIVPNPNCKTHIYMGKPTYINRELPHIWIRNPQIYKSGTSTYKSGKPTFYKRGFPTIKYVLKTHI